MLVKDGRGQIFVFGPSDVALFDRDRNVLVREDPDDQTRLSVLSAVDPSVRCIKGSMDMLGSPLRSRLWLLDHSHIGPSPDGDSDIYKGSSAFHFPPLLSHKRS